MEGAVACNGGRIVVRHHRLRGALLWVVAAHYAGGDGICGAAGEGQ